MGSETDEIERENNESDKDFDARKKASIIFCRYDKHKELFNKIQSMRYRFMAQIGKKRAEPFDELRNIVNHIFFSARMLAQLWSRDHFLTDEQHKKHLDDIQKQLSVFCDSLSEDDLINQKLQDIISKMETTCKEVISGAGTLHGFLNWPIVKKG